MTATVDSRYEGNFLEAIDLPEGARPEVTIEAISLPDEEKDAEGKVIKKSIVTFSGKRKRMILNKTNYRVLKTLFGPDRSQWIGKKVCLMRRYLPAAKAFGNHNEMCLRFIPPDGTPVPKSVRDYIGSATPITR